MIRTQRRVSQEIDELSESIAEMREILVPAKRKTFHHKLLLKLPANKSFDQSKNSAKSKPKG